VTCEICNGTQGGVPGNDNVIGGVVICDYCHVATNMSRKPSFENIKKEFGEWTCQIMDELSNGTRQHMSDEEATKFLESFFTTRYWTTEEYRKLCNERR
jgi:hypothetical protein